MTITQHTPEVSTTWIVVADRSRARILADPGDNKDLSEIETLVNPEGAMRQSECCSDRQGYFGGRPGALEAGDPETDFRHKTAQMFATRVIESLETGRASHSFGRVVLIAAPSFLGTLRQKLPAPLARMVELEVDKDYSKCSPGEIAAQLAKLKVVGRQALQ
ncbi:MAG: host attachment protein [Fuerstiella sp.]|nr:host attachment protein [Fuerstiella sp.]MCP4856746.1 host attachment protein [Fuerstiella sp.]